MMSIDHPEYRGMKFTYNCEFKRLQYGRILCKNYKTGAVQNPLQQKQIKERTL